MKCLRILGVILNTLGAIILAWRIKNIVDMLVKAQLTNDINFEILSDLIEGKPQKAPITLGMDKQVEKQQKKGVKLLVIGFSLIALGNILIGISWYLDFE